jgi:integrase/recombinase XerD
VRRRPASAIVAGPLSEYAAGFRAFLADQGYVRSTIEEHAFLMGHLSRWLVEQQLDAAALSGEAIDQFRAVRRESYSHLSGRRAMDQLLGYLRRVGVVPMPDALDSPAQRLVSEYCRYLSSERGLVEGSIVLRVRTARLFLGVLPEPLESSLMALTPADVKRFVVVQCGDERRGVEWSKTLISGLRSLLVFLHVSGRVSVPLAPAVPCVASWRLSSLPRGLEPLTVARLLESCNRRTVIGRRDFAILMLLARLGLRACEVVRLTVGDIDWRAGELVVHGKGGQTDSLPLPQDVGDALVEHLLGSNRDSDRREVFLRAFAPRGPITDKAAGGVLRDACDRAGVPRIGTHRLRHTVATELLAAGAALTEIAPILRHTNLSSTAIYAKVDRMALRALAQPWPPEASAG